MSTSAWDERYATDDYIFGEAPNAFLAAEAHRLAAGGRVLAVADGEGRNGVFLAERGHRVHAIDASAVGIAKARRLAAKRGVEVEFEQADLATWSWPIAAYDGIVAIFIQFADPALRGRLFAAMKAALKPGGVLLLEGYRTEQLDYRTGGPSDSTYLYAETLLREAFADTEIEHLAAYDAELDEGTRHRGPSALIDLVARTKRTPASAP